MKPASNTAAASAPTTRACTTNAQPIETQLTELAADEPPAPAPDLVSLLPEVTADLAALPPDLQAELLDVFDIQIIWNAPMRQATFRATITDTTPGIIAALFARASNDPGHSTKVWPPDPARTAATPTRAHTTPAPVQGSIHIPILRGTLPKSGGDRGGRASGGGAGETGAGVRRGRRGDRGGAGRQAGAPGNSAIDAVKACR